MTTPHTTPPDPTTPPTACPPTACPPSSPGAPSGRTPAVRRLRWFSPGRLRALRVLAGYGRDEFARTCGIDVGALERFERGQARPSPAVLRRMAHTLRQSVSALHTTVADADPAFEYWRAIVAVLPPMTDTQIAAVAVVLRRIDRRQRVSRRASADQIGRAA